jgi:hypothetical protein
MLVPDMSSCAFGNLKASLRLAGVSVDRIEFSGVDADDQSRAAKSVDQVAHGAAAAASVDLPFDRRAEARGLHVLELPSLPVVHNCTITANREWVVKHEDITLAFLRSMVDAIHFFKTERDRTCEILQQYVAPVIGLEGPDEVEHLHLSWSGLLSAKPYPHPLAVWNVYALEAHLDPMTNFIGPLEVWDTSWLRTIDDSGFIDELYGGPERAANSRVNAAITVADPLPAR